MENLTNIEILFYHSRHFGYTKVYYLLIDIIDRLYIF